MTATVVITGWREGLRKISMTQSLQAHAGLGVAAAKVVTDRVLDGQTVAVTLLDAATAAALARELDALGATCHVESGEAAG